MSDYQDDPLYEDDPNATSADMREDMNEALRHLHFMGMQTKHDMVDAVSRLYALIEELVANGQLDLRHFEERRARLRDKEEQRITERVHVKIDNTPDKYALTNLPDIDCASRIHLCKARCCKLNFPLSFQDLDERVVQWNYGDPYQIRQKPSGYCVHNDSTTGGCGVYNHRPATCRVYDCRNDKRIWLDFDNGIPAPDDAIYQDAPAGD